MAIEWVAAILAGRLVFDSATKLFEVARKDKSYKQQKIEVENQRDFQRSLQQENFRKQLELVDLNYKNALGLQENSEILRNYPLRLQHSQILSIYERNADSDSPLPLSVFLAPPKLRSDRIPSSDTANFPNIELQLIEIMKVGLSEYFEEGLADLKSGIWKSNEHYGETSVAHLYQIFPNLPILILESSVENDYFYIHAGFWTASRTNYIYRQIAKFSITAALTFYAITDAENWGKVRDKIVNSDRRLTPDENIQEHNWLLLQEANRDRAEGITFQRNYGYKFTSAHWRQFTQEVATCHALFAAWMADAYHLETLHLRPKLPHLLPELIHNSPLTKELMAQTVSAYQIVYRALEAETPHWVPQLHLELGEALNHLSDSKELVIEQVLQAIRSWLTAREIPIPADDELIDTMLTHINVDKREDRQELRRFRDYLMEVGYQTQYIERINELLNWKKIPSVSEGDQVMKNLSTELKDQLDEYQSMVSILQKELSPQQLIDIQNAVKRLEELKVTIAAFGETNAGKSSLLNALLGYSNDDPARPFHSSPVQGTWDDYSEEKNGIVWRDVQDLELVIYDTPGIAGDNPEHFTKAKRIAADADVILYVVWQAVKGDTQKSAMRELLDAGKPLIIAINQIDRQKPNEIVALKADLFGKMPEITEDMIVLTAGDPINGKPQIEDLVDKVSAIVEQKQYSLIQSTVEDKLHEGAELAALLIKKKYEERHAAEQRKVEKEESRLKDLEARAESVLDGYAKVAAGAAAIIPFGIDAITSTLISSGMFVHILNTFGKNTDFKTIAKIGKDLVEAFFGILAVSGLTLAGYMAISKGAKTNPFTYLLGMTLDGVFTYFIVYTIGQAFVYYCRNDLSWGARNNARNVMRMYVRQNINEMFLEKIPQKFREKINLDVEKL